MLQYKLLSMGDLQSIEESKKLFRTNINGILSKDKIRHYKYLFVASTTLACRAAITGGLEAQTSYNISDLYINRVDLLDDVDDIFELQTEMITEYTLKVAAAKKVPYNYATYTPEIENVLDYIYLHLHERLSLAELAEYANLSPNYLNRIFKEQTGRSIGDYILAKKVEVASNMLLNSSYSLTEIGAILGFCSTSHFVATFKRYKGITPRIYKTQLNMSADL